MTRRCCDNGARHCGATGRANVHVFSCRRAPGQAICRRQQSVLARVREWAFHSLASGNERI